MKAVLNVFWYASVASQVLLALYLLLSGLWRTYRIFTVYLALSPLRSALLICAGYHTQAYFQIWISSEALILALLSAAVLEVFYLSMKNYRVGRLEWGYMPAGALLIAAAVIYGGNLVEQNSGWQDLYLGRALLLKRTALAILMVFSLVMEWHWRSFPVAESTNLKAHRRIMPWYLAQALGAHLLVIALGMKQTSQPIYTGAMIASLGCFAAWGRWLRPWGECVNRPKATDAEKAAIEAHWEGLAGVMRNAPWRKTAGR